MLTFLTGCAIQDCKFRPHVEIQEPTQNNDSKTPQEKEKYSPTSMLRDIQDNARPSGEMVCTY
jgi:hypothetical protein